MLFFESCFYCLRRSHTGSPLLFRKLRIKPNKLPFLCHTKIRLYARIQVVRLVLFTRKNYRRGTRNCYTKKVRKQGKNCCLHYSFLLGLFLDFSRGFVRIIISSLVLCNFLSSKGKVHFFETLPVGSVHGTYCFFD